MKLRQLILIRVSLLLVLMGLLQFSYAPILSFVFCSAVHRVTGSPLEIKNLKASPFQTTLTTESMKLSYPKSSAENRLVIGQAKMELDWDSLLHKRLTLIQGRVDGLRLGTGSETGDKIAEGFFVKPKLVNDLLRGTKNHVAAGLTFFLTRHFDGDLEMTRSAQEFRERWSHAHAQLFERGKEVEKQIRVVRDIVNSFANSPLNTLRDLPRIEKAIKRSKWLRSELFEIRRRVERHQTQLTRDRDQFISANEQDLARIQKTTMVSRLNGQALSQLLVGRQQEDQVAHALAWFQWMRQAFSGVLVSTRPAVRRGQTVQFQGQPQQPGFLVQALEITGHAMFANQEYPITGAMADFTTAPVAHGKPALLQLEVGGKHPLTLEGMVDRTSPSPHDRITISIPSIPIAAQDLQIDDSVQLKLGQSDLQVIATIELIGDRLSGEVKAVQTNLEISIAFEQEDLLATEVQSMINQQLKSIGSFEVVASLSGSLKEPKWQLQCDLGSQIAESINGPLAVHYDAMKNELAIQVNQESTQMIDATANLLGQEQKFLGYLREKSRDVFKLEKSVSQLLQTSGARFR
ncbi:MAG: hypothetical protein VX438_19070 [Planctomycetota bacterium]|nr:hypothetical protein [Planctomycetota bacterium]